MKRLNVAVIGTGYFGKFHAEKYKDIPEVNLVGVVDHNRERAAEVASKNDTSVFLDPADLYDKVEAVSIAVPTNLHYAVAREFLSRGIHALVEKPLTVHVAEAEELVHIAQAKGVTLQVGHLERFNPALTSLHGTLTKPGFIESHRLQSFIDRALDVDVIMDLMIHDIDVILSLVQSDVKEVRATGVPVISSHIDIANARLAFENGCVANVTASRVSLKAMRKIRVFQPDAYFSIDFANRTVAIHRKEPSDDGSPFPKIVQERFAPTEYDALQAEVQSFVSAVLGGKAALVPGEDGLKALKVAQEIHHQIQKGF
jgi:predicted dehydrogenase